MNDSNFGLETLSFPAFRTKPARVWEFRAVHGRAGMAILRARTMGRTRAGSEATAAHEAVPGWGAQFDAASLAAEQHSASLAVQSIWRRLVRIQNYGP